MASRLHSCATLVAGIPLLAHNAMAASKGADDLDAKIAAAYLHAV